MVAGQIANIRDSLQRRHNTASRPQGYVEEESTSTGSESLDYAFMALGYSGKPRDPKSPIMVKAAAAPTEPAPRISFASWGQAFADYENRSGTFLGTDIGRNTTTDGVLGGADVTFPSVTSAADALVLGLLTGELKSRVHNADGSTARVNGPSIGGYGVYVNGGFSVDGTFKTDFLNLAQTTAGIDTPLRLTNYVSSGNVNYKMDYTSWWWEPTAGGSYTRTIWDGASKALGMVDGTDVRLQGGARVGTGFDWSGMRIDETLSAFLYDDVIITGGSIVTATTTPLAPTDMGKLFGQLIGKVEATLTGGWSGYVEGEVRGRQNIVGVAGRVGARYVFQ